VHHLFLESWDAAVPEKALAIGAVHQSGNAPVALPAKDAHRKRLVVREGASGVMAGGTGYRLVARESFVEKEFAAQPNFPRGQGIFDGDRHVRVQPLGYRQLEIGGRRAHS